METAGLTYCIKYQTWFSAEAHDPFCACMPLKAKARKEIKFVPQQILYGPEWDWIWVEEKQSYYPVRTGILPDERTAKWLKEGHDSFQRHKHRRSVLRAMKALKGMKNIDWKNLPQNKTVSYNLGIEEQLRKSVEGMRRRIIAADWAKVERDTYRQFMNFITCDPGFPGEETIVSEARRNLEVKMTRKLNVEMSIRLQMLQDEGWNHEDKNVSMNLGTEETLGLVLGIQSRAKRTVKITEEWAESLSDEMSEEQARAVVGEKAVGRFVADMDADREEPVGIRTESFTEPSERDLAAASDLLLNAHGDICAMKRMVHLRTDMKKAALVETLRSALELLGA